MGPDLTAGGHNPDASRRQAGIPVEKRARINQLCGSGLRAVAFGWQGDRNGDANLMVSRPGEHEPGATTSAKCADAPRWATSRDRPP